MKKDPTIKDHLFPKSYEAYYDIIVKAGIRTGLDKKTVPNCLRHGGLTELANQGLKPHSLRDIAGHACISTTFNHYIHVNKAELSRIRRSKEPNKIINQL